MKEMGYDSNSRELLNKNSQWEIYFFIWVILYFYKFFNIILHLSLVIKFKLTMGNYFWN